MCILSPHNHQYQPPHRPEQWIIRRTVYTVCILLLRILLLSLYDIGIGRGYIITYILYKKKASFLVDWLCL